MSIRPSQQDRAQLIPLNFAFPGFKGLNTELAGNILSQEWATTLDNAVFDETGRPSARKGWLSTTTTPVAGTVKRVHEYIQANGTSAIISSTDAAIFEGTTAPTARTGLLAIADGNIKFVNFNDKCVAFGIGTGGIPVVKTIAFEDITVNSGTAPTGRIGTSAFGRLWGVDVDGKTIRYSALLDETRWAAADGGGLFDMSSVWPAGQDEIVAITEFAGDMIVFGKNQTVIMTDGQGSELGIDPLSMYVSDTIPGVGAISQFAICRAAGDLWVLTRFGIVGLRREIQQRSTPFQNISKNIQSAVLNAMSGEDDHNNITLAYSPKESLVVAVFPSSRQQFTFDTRMPLEDGSYRATSWTSDLQTLTYVQDTAKLLGSFTTVAGEVLEYAGFSDDGTAYAFDYESGWMDLGSEQNLYLKFVKRLTTFVFVEKNVIITHKINYDFGLKSFTFQKSAAGGSVAEYGISEYNGNDSFPGYIDPADQSKGVSEYGGGITLRTIDQPGKSGGQFIQIGLRLNTASGDFSLQQINLFAKIGRLAT